MSRAPTIAAVILQTNACGALVRLEYVYDQPRWETSPSSRHQKALQRIERSVRPVDASPDRCGCFTLTKVLLRFPDFDRLNGPIWPFAAPSRPIATKRLR